MPRLLSSNAPRSEQPDPDIEAAEASLAVLASGTRGAEPSTEAALLPRHAPRSDHDPAAVPNFDMDRVTGAFADPNLNPNPNPNPNPTRT